MLLHNILLSAFFVGLMYLSITAFHSYLTLILLFPLSLLWIGTIAKTRANKQADDILRERRKKPTLPKGWKK